MRRPKQPRVKPDVASLISLLSTGVWLTAHDTTSGEYRNPAAPTGWAHGTFRQSGSAFLMRGVDGSPDWRFATLRSGRIVALPLSGKRHAQGERTTAAIAALRYMVGQNKTLPANMAVKGAVPCFRCGRTLLAGRSLTLRCHPTHGLGFFGPDCFKADTPEANKRAEGLARMNALLSAPVNPTHNPDCPCHKCK